MTQQHFTPPPELVQQWVDEYINSKPNCAGSELITTRAAQWGADRELEACCEYLVSCAQWEPEDVAELRAARRPKSQSLKEQSIAVLDLIQEAQKHWQLEDLDVVRRALESIPDPS